MEKERLEGIVIKGSEGIANAIDPVVVEILKKVPPDEAALRLLFDPMSPQELIDYADSHGDNPDIIRDVMHYWELRMGNHEHYVGKS